MANAPGAPPPPWLEIAPQAAAVRSPTFGAGELIRQVAGPAAASGVVELAAASIGSGRQGKITANNFFNSIESKDCRGRLALRCPELRCAGRGRRAYRVWN
jgi:hypothetical protein